MNTIRAVASWISIYLVGLLFLLTANAYALFAVLDAGSIKDTLRQENTYAAIVPSVLSGATYGMQSAGQLPLSAPWVRQATDAAFPADDLEQKGNTVIDSGFVWLEGKTDKPTFTLDFTQNKARLGSEVGNYVEQQLRNLPACDIGNLPDSFDVFTATCAPPGINPALLGQTASRQIVEDQNFLKDPVISSENFSLEALTGGTGAGTAGRSPLPQLDGLQTVYQNKTLLLWLLPLLTAVFAAGGVWLAKNRRAVLMRLARLFATTAIGLIVLGVLLRYGLERLITASAADSLTRDVFSPVLIALAGQLQMVYFIFAGIGIGLTIVAFLARRKISVKSKGVKNV